MLYDETLATLTRDARRFSDKAAIVNGDMTLSYTELDDRVAALAGALTDRRLTPGDVVSLWAPTCWQWVVAYHAVMRAGLVVNPLNAMLAADEVAFIMGHCRSKALIADDDRHTRLAESGRANILACFSLEDVERLSGAAARHEPVKQNAEQLSTICYTSGTTGRPKGAMLSHRNVLLNAALTAMVHGRSAEDVTVTALPLAHVYGNVVMNGTLMTGGTLVLLSPFDAGATIAALETHRATRFEAVPTMYYFMLGEPSLDTTDLSALKFCTVGGQTMPEQSMREVETRFGCPLIELWGMSEIGGLGTTFAFTGPRTLGSIGHALPMVDVRVAADGELQVKGPIVMTGYLDDPEATAGTIDVEGWLSTGDIARIDQQGQVFIVDRKKDVILTSGNNVYPAEIERVLAMHPAVAMSAVGRDAHAEKGEVAHAYIVLKSGAAADAEAILAHCRGALAPYKLPRAISFVVDLPRNSTGKILRRELGR